MSAANGHGSNGVRRVVVTGMGAVSALGNDVASTWAGLLAGRSGIRTIQSFDPSRVDSKIAGEVREFGWKVIVNGGSAGYVFDGDPTASWALVTFDDGTVSAEIKRTEYDVLPVSNAISARGLPGDVYRAATVRTGKLVR